MFETTFQKGFGITFANGWAVSVQWGPGNYGDNYRADQDGRKTAAWSSTQAEICVVTTDERGGFNTEKQVVSHPYADIEGYASPERVAEIMAVVAKLPPFDGKIPEVSP